MTAAPLLNVSNFKSKMLQGQPRGTSAFQSLLRKTDMIPSILFKEERHSAMRNPRGAPAEFYGPARPVPAHRLRPEHDSVWISLPPPSRRPTGRNRIPIGFSNPARRPGERPKLQAEPRSAPRFVLSVDEGDTPIPDRLRRIVGPYREPQGLFPAS